MTVQDNLSDRRGTLSRTQDSLRRCQTVYQTGGAPAGDFQTVCDHDKTIRTHTGDSQTVCNGARQSPRPVGHMQETPIHSTTCKERLCNFRRLPDSLLHCPTVYHSVEDCLGISCRCPDDLHTVAYCLGVSCRCLDVVRECSTPSGSLMQVPGRSWPRQRLSGIFLLVHRRSCILSGTVCESPAGAQTSFQHHRLSGSLLPVPRRSG
ncbi:hypothetical protein DPMN_043826 [Dreissena polymorpha]|uniref:Uncharacterized protein n=1 Tax=Dreissena polymorpha TaxID=45954 RepID=A0A9D4HY76_DREPO|nr:hypothetical protein DPMN_043826 [Dreissena polymorpha]